jgi:hypothetical protein
LGLALRRGYPRNMEAFRATYEVAHDPQVSKRVNLAAMRHSWKRWVGYGFSLGGHFAFMGAFSWVLVSYAVSTFSSDGLLLTSLFWIAVGLLTPVYYYIQRWDKREKDPYRGEVWQCDMTELGWSFQGKSGMLRFIPWELIRPTFEHEDGWLARCEEVELLIYRKPLREAGLEEVFRARMGRKPKERPGQS